MILGKSLKLLKPQFSVRYNGHSNRITIRSNVHGSSFWRVGELGKGYAGLDLIV